MKIRYIGSDPDGVELVCSGTSYGVVHPDEVVEVPDEVHAAHGWSEELWAVVAPAKAKKGDD
jgi:hypothetical protein